MRLSSNWSWISMYNLCYSSGCVKDFFSSVSWHITGGFFNNLELRTLASTNTSKWMPKASKWGFIQRVIGLTMFDSFVVKWWFIGFILKALNWWDTKWSKGQPQPLMVHGVQQPNIQVPCRTIYYTAVIQSWPNQVSKNRPSLCASHSELKWNLIV